VSAISTLFDWSKQHISEISNKDFLGYFTDDEDDIKNAITQPVITKHPTSDDRVWYCDEGDGPWCLYAYICSMQQLMRNALEQKLALMYMVQVPSPDPQAAQRKLDLEKFNSVPHYFYADGSAILKGDAVLFDYGRFPGLVIDFMVSTGTDGKLFPAAVLVGEGKQGQQRAVGLNAMMGGRFAELQFVERNTTDFVRAGVDWLHQRATQGDASAQFSLGNLYVIGNNVAQDDAQGIAWWRKAADKNYALAQFHLGGMYYRGQGVAVDQTQARQWWRKAAEQGHPAAQFQIGFAYAHGLDVVQNMEQACDWYRKAADQGYSNAQYSLGYRYQEGDGVAQDFAVAVEWYRKAAQQGHAWAQCNLADKYEHGLGVQQDYAQALEWYLKSQAQGVAEAMYSLGGINKNGLGVAPNDQAAAQWWRKAAALGYEDAKKSLEAMAPNLGESTP
jgi:TPR repeat protein